MKGEVEMRYYVWFRNCPEQIEFDNLKDAEHYARMNAGCVYDTETGNTVCEFEEDWE